MAAPECVAELEDYAEFFDATMPWEDGTVVMLKAYFDASKRDSGVFCVAGVAFGLDRAKKAEKEWRSIFGNRRCHMTDLHARKGDFEGISKEEGGTLCREAVRTINSHASFVVAVSCDIDEVERLRPKAGSVNDEPLLDSARSSYNCGLHWVMGAMGDTVQDKQQHIQYWFERGDEYQGAARRFLAFLNETNPGCESLRQHYCYGSDAFALKTDVRLFEIADLIAWEWGKHVDRVRAGKAARPSLAALMGGPCVTKERPFCKSATRYGNHYSGPPLEKYFRNMHGLIRATSHEEIDAVARGEASPSTAD